MNDFMYADPATLEGQLQRGRGLGAHSALAAPGAADLVYECVITDSRWDRQTEHRDSYLARLVHRLDLPLAPIERHLFAHDDDDPQEVEPALQVLALLPFVGRVDAVSVLRRYAIEGRHWASALEAIGWGGGWKISGVWTGLDEDVIARRDDAQLAAHTAGGEPWTSWARTQPRIRRILDERTSRRSGRMVRPPDPRSCVELSAAELVGLIGADTSRDRRSALQELSRRGDLVVLDLAEDVGLRNAAGWTPGMPQALNHLGAAAVARARTWTRSGDATLEQLAVGVLSDFGDRDDYPYLLNELTSATAAGAWCAAESPAKGLGRLRIAEATDALVHAWETTVHSYAREAFLEGLRGCAPDTADNYAVEGLDDCEPCVQQAASAAAPDTAYVRTRLRELCDDPLAPEIHEAVRQRLMQLTVSGSAR
ncbi:hypothetical protein [Kitasatospora sp. NPDC017646]|uniref:hypothetical protein n=1 Tax=Kitasatospora sp. NPDC017646 TaxID=3364024 RepID=UPI0037B2C389